MGERNSKGSDLVRDTSEGRIDTKASSHGSKLAEELLRQTAETSKV